MKYLLVVLVVCSLPALARGEETTDKLDPAKKEELAAKASLVLRRNCLQCHHGAGSASNAHFDVRDPQSMIDAGMLSPGDSKGSEIWKLPNRGTMPPKSQPQLRSLIGSDLEALAAWIDAGCPEFPKVKARTPVKLQTVLEAIQAHQKKLKEPRVQARQRYFSFVEMHNNPDISDEKLNLARAGLSKAINSLSWERELVIPKSVPGTSDTLLVVDLVQVGWNDDQWQAIKSHYPFGVGFENLPDDTLKDLDQAIFELMGKRETQYVIRADWFIATATRPPLYHTILYDLYLPELRKRLADGGQPNNPKQMTARDLEQYLGVDVISDIEQGEPKVWRSGFTPSGVSEQNRLLERHLTRFGAYWKSYDFKADNRRAILAQFPLGPVFPGNPFSKQAFEHDGGEIIFNLPNGLQAYMLVDGKDRRIDAGPIEVVSDALKTSGSPAIVNGVSCFACHKQGMINPPADEIREFSLVFGKEKEQVKRLYPPQDAMQAKVDTDAKLFLQAAQRATLPFLQVGPDKGREFEGFPEPVSDVARQYALEELDLETVASELNLISSDGTEVDTKTLENKIRNDERLRQLGMGILLRRDGKIKRAFWESSRGGASVMQITAFTLDFSIRQYSK